jgi:hypothetical protein
MNAEAARAEAGDSWQGALIEAEDAFRAGQQSRGLQIVRSLTAREPTNA